MEGSFFCKIVIRGLEGQLRPGEEVSGRRGPTSRCRHRSGIRGCEGLEEGKERVFHVAHPISAMESHAESPRGGIEGHAIRLDQGEHEEGEKETIKKSRGLGCGIWTRRKAD